MVPEYWLTEGGQSATGALLDHVIENHVASPLLANRAASQSKISIVQLSQRFWYWKCVLFSAVIMQFFPLSYFLLVMFPGVSVFELLNKILESLKHDLKTPFLAALTENIHVLPDYHGNRY